MSSNNRLATSWICPRWSRVHLFVCQGMQVEPVSIFWGLMLCIQTPLVRGNLVSVVSVRFPFDQKFRKFRVGERMEQSFSGISFQNFGCTSRGWPKIPENRNTRKKSSTIPARA